MSGWPQLHADDEAAGETVRVHPSDPDGDYYHPPASSVPAPPVSAPPRVRNSSAMFMVTVMVVVVVAGAVSVAYLLTSGRNSAPQAGAAVTVPPSAASSASSRVDQCVVGEWLGTSWRLTDTDDTSLTTDNGGILRLRADGTGEFDLGSGITLNGKLSGVTVEEMIIGKLTFTYETANQTLTSRVVGADARRVIFESGRTVTNERYGDDGTPTEDRYTCTGDGLHLTSDGQELEYRRR
jgi:hypothetical protein